MRPLADSYNIVILGAWNPSIFSPEWVLRNLAESEQCEVKTAFPIDDPTAPRRITFEDINIFPGRRQILLNPVTSNLEGMKKCSSVLVKILDLLLHTPVSSAGVNFSFNESNPSDKMLAALMPSDSGSILAEYPIKETKINRVLKRDEDSCVFNFSITQNDTGCILSYNFHYDDTIDGYKRIFSSDIIEQHLNSAIAFAAQHYEVELEADETEE